MIKHIRNEKYNNKRWNKYMICIETNEDTDATWGRIKCTVNKTDEVDNQEDSGKSKDEVMKKT